MVTAPCKDCKDRFVGCHSSCDKYKEFRINLDEEREKTREEKKMIYALYENRTKRVEKALKKKNRW